MRDITPEENEKIETIRETFIELSRVFGYKLMETSPIELLSTLKLKSGPDIVDEIYHFQDKAGREVGLRFDLTVGLTRFVTSRRDLQLPVKLCSFSSMWRYDEPQHGRYRWFYQWDAEIFGAKNIEADAEIIEFTYSIFKNLGLETCSIQIGDRKIIEEFIRTKLKIVDEKLVLKILRIMDKVKKKPSIQIIEEFKNLGLQDRLISDIVEFSKIHDKPDRVINRLQSLNINGLEPLIHLTDSLNDRGVRNVSLNLGIVRGLDYYTRIVFEVFDKENEELGALAGGGRYDTLPALFGRTDFTATGVAGGVERMLMALSKEGNKKKKEQSAVFIAYATHELSRPAHQLTSKLRSKGIISQVSIIDRSLHKQMEMAAASGASYVLIVAPKEFSKNKIVVKNMNKRTENLLSIEKVESLQFEI
jgi:histidyl-tRNA synthetase